MAFKMKGFPYKSGFKHTGGEHEDHHASSEGANESAESDDHMDVQFTPKEKKYYISELESYHGIKFDENNPQHMSLLRSFKKKQPM